MYEAKSKRVSVRKIQNQTAKLGRLSTTINSHRWNCKFVHVAISINAFTRWLTEVFYCRLLLACLLVAFSTLQHRTQTHDFALDSADGVAHFAHDWVEHSFNLALDSVEFREFVENVNHFLRREIFDQVQYREDSVISSQRRWWRPRVSRLHFVLF